MKIIFAGTPEFARCALAALHSAGHEITLVLTQPDRPAGRGLRLQASPVKQFALEHNIPISQPRSLRLDGKFPADAQAAHQLLKTSQPTVMVVAAYGLILPQTILEIAPYGCINIHASLLPRWRGAAPIQRAIEAGDKQTGISIMQMDVGLDTGAVLSVQPTPIAADDNAQTLHDRLAQMGAQAIVQTIERLQHGGPELLPTPQSEHGISYAAKISKSEAILDFRQTAQQLADRIRAFDPYPGCVTNLQGTTLKIFRARAISAPPPPWLAAPGTIVALHAESLDIATGAGQLRVWELQKPGGKRLSVAQCLSGPNLAVGERLGS